MIMKNQRDGTKGFEELMDLVQKRLLIEEGAGKYRKYKLTQG
jgi:hypothetical protein